MVYAKADKRWAGADLTVISLELLTVLCAGPLALYICVGISRKNLMVPFWMIVLATGELYGGPSLNPPILHFPPPFFSFVSIVVLILMKIGFMTFCPEWLTGNQNLDASNFMFKWVYLVFFNMLWVVLPLYALYVSFIDIQNAFVMRKGMIAARMELMRREAEAETEREKEKESKKGK
jgi:hypothetical protein